MTVVVVDQANGGLKYTRKHWLFVQQVKPKIQAQQPFFSAVNEIFIYHGIGIRRWNEKQTCNET